MNKQEPHPTGTEQPTIRVPQFGAPSADMIPAVPPAPIQTTPQTARIPAPEKAAVPLQKPAPADTAPQTARVSAPAEQSAPAEPAQPEALADDTVTEHTATLWKYIPVAPDSLLPHAEYDTQTVSIGGTTVYGASVRGKKHKHEGSNRDDWFTVGQAGDWVLLAVSDGAGSKAFSRVGAQVSCEAAVAHLTTAMTALRQTPGLCTALAGEMQSPAFQGGCGQLAKALQDAVVSAWDAVSATATAAADDARYTQALGRAAVLHDFSATLLLAVVIPLQIDGADEQLIVTCQIGDGAIALIRPDAPYDTAEKSLGEADSGDFAGETDFLTAEKMRQPAQLMPRTRISRGAAGTLLVMTDGISDDYYPNDPQLRRLYLDLLLCGILPPPLPAPRLTPAMLRVLQHIPKPIAYPWVNDPTRTLALSSMQAICTAARISLADAWALRALWGNAAAIRRPLAQLPDPATRLSRWLDHYVARGSFDDRTLVIISPGQEATADGTAC